MKDVVVLHPNRVVNRAVAVMTLSRLIAEEPGSETARGAEIAFNLDEVDYVVEVDVGETFPVADQVWRLDSVRDEAGFAATISRIS